MRTVLKSLLAIGLLSLLSPWALAQERAPVLSRNVIVPRQTVPLFNNKDLSGWYTWLTDDRYEDPRGVFTVQNDGLLKISGDGFGGLISRSEYADYHLTLEYRWGTATYRSRAQKARDGGLLLHCQGAEGNYGGSDGQPGPWMTSIECQVIEGGVGDLLVLSGKDENNQPIPAEVTTTVTRRQTGGPVWSAEGKQERFQRGRVDWFGRDPDWQDVRGFRGQNDVESPGQEWTKVECYCAGDTLTYVVNGIVVNRATGAVPRSGKIFLQTEGAEMFVRRLDIQPLPSVIP